MNPAQNRSALKILVVDDEMIIARSLQRTLMDLGNDVPDVACSGAEAIEKCEFIKPDLVFMDIRLASGMDGIETAGMIREKFGIPVIFVTAYADEDTLQRAKTVAPYGYLIKPVTERDIRIIIEVAMGRYRAEQLLEHSERKNRLIVKTAYDAFVGMSETGSITEWNPQAEATFGWSRAEVLGRPLREIVIPQRFREAHSKGLKRFLETGEGRVLNRRIQVSALHRDGHEFPVELTISVLHFGDDYLFSAFVHDISERVKAEMELKKSRDTLEEKVKARTAQLEALNAKLVSSNTELEQFAGVAAHDLRSPMKSIVNWVDMLDELIPGSRTRQIDQAIEFIRSNAEKGDRLIGDILELVRVSAADTRTEEVDLNKLVANVLAVLRENIDNVSAELIVSELPKVRGNPTYIEVVFRNLIQNALTYRHKSRAPRIVVSCRNRGEFYEFSVMDNGIGIAQENTDKIFAMFKRLNGDVEYLGTGIGLAFCKKIIELYQGKIWVESTLDKGSTFYFTYPRKSPWGER